MEEKQIYMKASETIELLLEIVERVEFFHTPDGEAYASAVVDGHRENWPVIPGSEFETWLIHQVYAKTHDAPSKQGLAQALAQFKARAIMDGLEHSVFLRTAECGGRSYLDLGDKDRTVVEIDNQGWRLVSKSPVRFRRAPGMRPLPRPMRGGNIERLRQFVNVSDADWILVVAWLLVSLRPKGPFPVAVLQGEQGSAKSTTARVLRSLVDPNAASLRSDVRDVRDLMIAATNGWIITLDNLSNIPAWLSDALCRVATGGAFATRELYSDKREVLFDAQRPIILNGIEELATRGDLLSRYLLFRLPRIPEANRRPESEFWSAFDDAQPSIFGSLLDALVIAMRILPQVKVTTLPRMADFALLGTAAEVAFGWTEGAFMAAYKENGRLGHETALDASPITPCLYELLDGGYFEGTAQQLLTTLMDIADRYHNRGISLPKSANRLSNMLHRLAPNLRANEWEIEFFRENDRNRTRKIKISRASEYSRTPDDADGSDDVSFAPTAEEVGFK